MATPARGEEGDDEDEDADHEEQQACGAGGMRRAGIFTARRAGGDVWLSERA